MLVYIFALRYISTQEEKHIGMVNCLSPRSYRTGQAVKGAFPARGWSCLLCSVLKPVTMWPSSSTAVQTQPGSSLTAWPTEMVRVTDFGWCACCDSKPKGILLLITVSVSSCCRYLSIIPKTIIWHLARV